MSEIKLGWYRSETDGYTRDYELLAIRRTDSGEEVGCAWSGVGAFSVSLDCLRRREYLGTEQPKKGRWVDFDPAKFTCDQFPIKGRVSDSGHDWLKAEVIGYLAGKKCPYISDALSSKRFQIWEVE